MLIVVLAVVVVGGVVAGLIVARRPKSRRPKARPAGADQPEPTAAGPPAGVAVPRAPAPPGAEGLGGRIRSLFGSGVTEETWRGLEDALIRADVGPKAAADVVARVRRSYRPQQDPAEVVAAEIRAVFEPDPGWMPPEGDPGVVMVVGVNGTGKTTTIGKLAHLLAAQRKSVSLAASDTFRAAAGEQLETWARRAGAHVVSQERGADPGAVAFDAVRAARARGSNIVIVDTAGRLHTKQPLMDELRKVRRVLEKAAGRPPDEVLLVLDATTGQNGIAQARAFTEAVDVSGVVLTKLDGTARGGIVLAVREELGIPVKLVGTGEGIDDLAPFDPGAFARALLE